MPGSAVFTTMTPDSAGSLANTGGAGSPAWLPRLSRWALLGLTAFLLFWNLGANSLHTYDEAGHALVVREMLETGDWMTLHANGLPYFNKGPLSFWLSAVAMRIGGVNEWSVRFFSALAAFFTIVTLSMLGDRVFGAPAGTLAGAVLLTSHQYLYHHCARTGDVDSFLTLFWTLGALLVARAVGQRSASLLLLGFTSIGFCGLAKHLGMVPLGVLLVGSWALLSGGWRRFPARVWAAGIALPILVILPWTAWQLLTHGQAFLDAHFGREVLARAAGNLPDTPPDRYAGGPLYVFATLKNGFFPWSLVVPFALVELGRGTKERRRLNLSLGIWIVGILALAMISAGQARRYVLPAYPALALLVGLLLARLFRRSAEPFALAASAAAALVALLSRTTALSHNPFAIHPRRPMLSADLLGRLPENSGLRILTLAAALVAILLLTRLGKQDRGHGRWSAASLGVLALVALFQVVAPLHRSTYKHPFNETTREVARLRECGYELWTALGPPLTDSPIHGFYLWQLEPGVHHSPLHPGDLARDLLHGGRRIVLLTHAAIADQLFEKTSLPQLAKIEVAHEQGRFVVLRIQRPQSPSRGHGSQRSLEGLEPTPG